MICKVGLTFPCFFVLFSVFGYFRTMCNIRPGGYKDGVSSDTCDVIGELKHTASFFSIVFAVVSLNCWSSCVFEHDLFLIQHNPLIIFH